MSGGRTGTHPDSALICQRTTLDVGTAYAIQRALLARKVAGGERVIGAKLGLTSLAKQVQMGVHHPIYGILTDYNLLPDGILTADRFIQPRVEPEIALLMGEDLRGPGITEYHVHAATRLVFPAIEVIDSRFADFKFTLEDVISDNASSAGMALGGMGVAPTGVDLSLIGVVLEVDGQVVATGAGAAVLGHPFRSVAWLVNQMAASGQSLRAGDIVLSGAITAAFALNPGSTATAHFDRIGSVTVTRAI